VGGIYTLSLKVIIFGKDREEVRNAVDNAQKNITILNFRGHVGDQLVQGWRLYNYASTVRYALVRAVTVMAVVSSSYSIYSIG